jgi:hypothetical protein
MAYRRLIAVAAIPLVAAACGGTSSSTTPSGAPGSSAAAAGSSSETMASTGMASTGAAMALPAGAENLKVAITSPADGTKVTANSVTLGITATGYALSCDLAGKPDMSLANGHYHVLLDKALVNMFCTPTATVSLQNVKPGIHTLTVVPALNDHAEVMPNEKSIMIDYEPTSPLPTIVDDPAAGTPSIQIVSPAAGATVTGAFDVVVNISGFDPSCDLYGKPGVAGYGHWHLNLDTMNGPMMGMGTMLGMSCQTVFHASTAGLKPGSTHTLIALLADNGHAPLMPAVDAKVDVTIG